MRNAYKIVVGNPEGTRSLRRSRRRWEDNISMTMVGCCGHGYEPSGFINGGEFLDQLSDYQLLKDYSPWQSASQSVSESVS
jgi:hypothetical protein